MKYKFEVTIESGHDEFWDENPTPEVVLANIEADLQFWTSQIKLVSWEDDDGQLRIMP